ncbi:hypothetical protein ACP3TM_05390 [Staphylococcus sp. IPLA37010]|uniref:Pathogenicity island protein n=1 Tax=Staphylococcus equorum TaxID=246432 RepID=A0AAW7AHS2_9STAP|nr:hypothetical protein [Staphylococcus equorum]MDK9866409.1 hypothetical protein [Staphylococcus equorum]
MLYTEKVQESVEFADLRNKIESILDYVSAESSELESEREFAMKSNQPIVYQMINNNIKQNYIISSVLLAIEKDIENMHDDVQVNIEQEKNALSHADQSEDNA